MGIVAYNDVSQLGYGAALSAKLFKANSTIYNSVIATICCASRINRVFYYCPAFCVTKCLYSVCNICVTAVASISGVSFLGASWCGHNCIVAVSRCRDFCIGGVITT